MKKLILSSAVAGLAILTLVATVAAADPTPTPTPARDQVRAGDVIPAILGLTQQQIIDLRHDGLSLAQIAERQKVDPQKLVDALVARWTERIEARLANGALTSTQAAQLRTQVELRARDMVHKTALGGMRGAAVGAGPRNGAGPGNGQAAGRLGTGSCGGGGPYGLGRP